MHTPSVNIGAKRTPWHKECATAHVRYLTDWAYDLNPIRTDGGQRTYAYKNTARFGPPSLPSANWPSQLGLSLDTRSERSSWPMQTRRSGSLETLRVECSACKGPLREVGGARWYICGLEAFRPLNSADE